MAATIMEARTVSDFAADLYDRLIDTLVDSEDMYKYIAAEWYDKLLEPLGYERSDQDAVSKALVELDRADMVHCEAVKVAGGYQARRHETAKPRTVRITILR